MKKVIYKGKDPKTGQEFTNDLTILPYISLPKDTLVLMTECLSPEQVGCLICDVVNDLYCDSEYGNLRDNSAVGNAMYRTIMNNIGRLSAPYFKRIRNLNNIKNRDKDNG